MIEQIKAHSVYICDRCGKRERDIDERIFRSNIQVSTEAGYGGNENEKHDLCYPCFGHVREAINAALWDLKDK
jgi:hypothetical protein